MPRHARELSKTGVYHVMLRGVNRQQVFFDEEDHMVFLEKLKKQKEKLGFKLFAYCLMPNHIHLLIMIDDEKLKTLFRAFGASYVLWYNKKYDRVGHLFQDRFKSETVQDEKYFMTVLRYILRNPIKANLCSKANDYKYSSMSEYTGVISGITDVDFVLEMVGRQALIDFIDIDNRDSCMDDDERLFHGRLRDEEALEMIRSEFDTEKYVKKDARNASVIRLLKKGISVAQIVKYTGISKGTVRKIRNEA